MAKMTYIKAITNGLDQVLQDDPKTLILVKMLVKTVVCSVQLKDFKISMAKTEYLIHHWLNQEF